MANKKIWVIMYVILISLLLFGCDSDSDIDTSLNGVWINRVSTGGGAGGGAGDGPPPPPPPPANGGGIVEYELRLNNGNFEEAMDGMPLFKGTYTTSSGIIIFTATHVHGITIGGLENKWYSRNELGYEFLGYMGYSIGGFGRILSREMVGYLVTPNNLTFIDGNVTLRYVRKIE